jgi:uncharacterized membrane protein
MVVVALLVAIAGVLALPGTLMNVAIDRLSAGGVNQMSHGNLATPENQPVVRPSPDLAYSACPYDLSAGPVMVMVHPIAGRYQSLSIFDAETDVIFVRNDVQAGGKPYGLVLALEGQKVPDRVEVVRTAYPKGIALIRLLLTNPAELPSLLPERAKSTCGVFVAVPAK